MLRDGILHEQENLIIKGGYYLEVSGSDRKKVVWELVD